MRQRHLERANVHTKRPRGLKVAHRRHRLADFCKQQRLQQRRGLRSSETWESAQKIHGKHRWRPRSRREEGYKIIANCLLGAGSHSVIFNRAQDGQQANVIPRRALQVTFKGCAPGDIVFPAGSPKHRPAVCKAVTARGHSCDVAI